ncbi:CASP-like protein 2A1 [Malania oleifera]|uniref:CASP-like protein 2A1 n=1 Tax=Malania oleifera TaxID=397392 RepID=UPI0025AE3D68|nr:CASP-like protein 2A1 [Malania oleifera]
MEKGDKGGAAAAGRCFPMEMVMRLVPMALCIAALVVMLKTSESNDYGSLSYSNLGPFRYLVDANGICAAYSLLSAIFSAIHRPFTMSMSWAFFFLDQLSTYIVLAAGAVATEAAYLAYKGNKSAAWSTACGSFGAFCHKALASVAISFLSVLCYAALSLFSSYRLFSKFPSPTQC